MCCVAKKTHPLSTLRWAGLIAAMIVSTASSKSQAQTPISQVRWDAHLDLGYAFGAGFRADIPIVREGFIDNVADDLVISPGAELFFFDYHDYYRDSGVGFAPLVALQWNFYITPEWSAFPELGFAMLFGRYGYWHDRHDRDVYASLFLGIGGRYHFNDKNALLLRLSWPAGLQFGITF